MCTNLFEFEQSHMNKDHEEDTKAIVHHVTSIPVSNYYSIHHLNLWDPVEPINVCLWRTIIPYGYVHIHDFLNWNFRWTAPWCWIWTALVSTLRCVSLSHPLSVSSWNKSYLPRYRLLFKGTLSSSEFLSQDAHKTESKTLSLLHYCSWTLWSTDSLRYWECSKTD